MKARFQYEMPIFVVEAQFGACFGDSIDLKGSADFEKKKRKSYVADSSYSANVFEKLKHSSIIIDC